MAVTIERASAKKARTHTIYRLQDGTRVPSVTTVLGVLNKPGLLKWAWELGAAGIEMDAYRDDLADVGRLAHQMIHAHLTGGDPDALCEGLARHVVDRAQNSFLKFLHWQDQHDVQVILTEQPLVSETYRFGGTLDIYAYLDGSPVLIDLKTSKAIYDEFFLQLAAYRQLATEHGYAVEGLRLLRIGRAETEGFEERVVSGPEMDSYWREFECALRIYQIRAERRKGAA